MKVVAGESTEKKVRKKAPKTEKRKSKGKIYPVHSSCVWGRGKKRRKGRIEVVKKKKDENNFAINQKGPCSYGGGEKKKEGNGTKFS